MLSLLFLAAQAVSGSAPATSPCEIIAEKDERGVLLIGSCGRSAVMLGSATSYEIASNPGTGAVVAVTKRGEETQVLIVRPDEEGHAFLENVTADLARQSGRAPDTGLVGLMVDISRFQAEGVVEVAPVEAESKVQSRERPAEFSVAAMIANEATRLAMPQEKPNVVEVVSEGQGANAQ